MHPYAIPWNFLDHTDPHQNPPKPSAPTQTLKTTKTFAQALSNVCDVPESQLPLPCLKGGNLAIEIPEEEWVAGVQTCKHNLQGRVIWPKGATPLTVLGLKNKLAPLWKGLARWGVTSIGYFTYGGSNSKSCDR